MSGAQGAQPKGSLTATTYESVQGGENRTRTDIRSKEDQGKIQIDKIQDKVEDAAGQGGPVFGAGKDTNKQDLGVPHIATDEALPERPGEPDGPVRGSSGSTMYPQRPGQTKYMKTGLCNFGRRCKFHHPVVRSNPSTNHATQKIVKLTLAGLPKREGIIMCPHYMRTGSCKYSANCKYNHPSPREVIAKALQIQPSITSTDSGEGDE